MATFCGFESFTNDLRKNTPPVAEVGLAKDQREFVDKAINQMGPYKTAFDSLSSARQTKDEAFAAWAVDSDGASRKNCRRRDRPGLIRPSKRLEASGNAADIVKWSRVASDLDQKVMQNFLLLRVNAIYLTVTTADEQWTKFQEQLRKLQEGMADWTKSVKGNTALETVAGNFSGFFKEYETAGKKYYEGILKDRKSTTDIAGIGTAITETATMLQDHIKDDVNSIMKLSNWLSIMFAVASISIGIILAIFIARSITKPINKVIEGLTNGSDQVTQASGQVSSASQSLAQGANEQASALEEISSSLEEMSSMTRQNADNANQAKGLSTSARDSAEEGKEKGDGADGRGHRRHQDGLGPDRAHPQDHRRDRFPDQPPGAERRRRSGACRGRGQGSSRWWPRKCATSPSAAPRRPEYADLIEGSTKNAEAGVVTSNEVAKTLLKIRNSASKQHVDRGDCRRFRRSNRKGLTRSTRRCRRWTRWCNRTRRTGKSRRANSRVSPRRRRNSTPWSPNLQPSSMVQAPKKSIWEELSRGLPLGENLPSRLKKDPSVRAVLPVHHAPAKKPATTAASQTRQTRRGDPSR